MVQARGHSDREDTATTLYLDSTLANSDVAGAAAEKAARDVGLTDAVAQQVRTCVVEAVNNAVLHAYGGKPGHSIEFRLHRGSECLVVEVEESGEAMIEPPDPGEPVVPESWEDVAVGGRGWWIIRSWMDEVAYSSTGKTNVLKMIKKVGKPLNERPPATDSSE